MNKKNIIYYVYGYLKFLAQNNQNDQDVFKRLNIMIARYSNDKLIRNHRRFQDTLNKVTWDKEAKISEREAFPELYINRDYYDKNETENNYNPDLDLDQQHPDFYV